MPVVSLDDFSLTLTDNITGEGNMLTIVLSDNNNTTCNPGFTASVLTECVRAHDVMSEFFMKFPDQKNVTFEETDVDWTGRMSLSVLPSIRRKKGNTQSTIAPCTVVIGRGNRDKHGVHVSV